MDPRTTRANKLKLRWGLICLIGPMALIIVSLVIYTIVNLVIGSVVETDSPNAITVVVNIVLYLVGAVSVLTFVPGIVVGIVLLATRK